jgi:aspartyl-tRNA(Asn)/glutamyl-tRNA(Gln) amidotransferase subunit A
MVPFALGSDTGGSIRQPAGFCGVYGLKPTYGTVSRYGLVSYASSLEVIGILAKQVNVLKNIYKIIRGKDDYDQTSVDFQGTKKEIKKIGIFKNLDAFNVHKDVHTSYQISIDRIKKSGIGISEVSFSLFDYIAPAYYTIATAEASANLARYNGVRFGLRPDFSDNPDELVRKARSEGFGDEVKLRVLLGTFVLRSGFQDEYYLKAQKIRTAIRNEMDKLFQDVDLLLLPVFPVPPFNRDNPELDPFQQKMADSYTCLANLAGVPALSIPSAVLNDLPVGVQLMGPSFSEENLFTVAEKLELQFPCPSPPIKLDEWSE